MIKKFEAFSIKNTKLTTRESRIRDFDNLVKSIFPDHQFDSERVAWSFDYRGYDIVIRNEKTEYLYLNINDFYLAFLEFDIIEKNNLLKVIEDYIRVYDYKIELIEIQKKIHKELQEINKEDLEIIFQDLTDIDEVDKFTIDYVGVGKSEYFSSVEINFRYGSASYKSLFRSSNDLRLASNFYKCLGESIERIESLYDQLNISMLYDLDENFHKWKIIFTLK